MRVFQLYVWLLFECIFGRSRGLATDSDMTSNHSNNMPNIGTGGGVTCRSPYDNMYGEEKDVTGVHQDGGDMWTRCGPKKDGASSTPAKQSPHPPTASSASRPSRDRATSNSVNSSWRESQSKSGTPKVVRGFSADRVCHLIG